MDQWVYGVANADDLRRYDSAINNISNDQNDMIRIVHEQVSILRSALTNFDNCVTPFNIYNKPLDTNLKTVEKSINLLNNRVNNNNQQIAELKSMGLTESKIFESNIFMTRL